MEILSVSYKGASAEVLLSLLTLSSSSGGQCLPVSTSPQTPKLQKRCQGKPVLSPCADGQPRVSICWSTTRNPPSLFPPSLTITHSTTTSTTNQLSKVFPNCDQSFSALFTVKKKKKTANISVCIYRFTFNEHTFSLHIIMRKNEKLTACYLYWPDCFFCECLTLFLRGDLIQNVQCIVLFDCIM